MTTNKPDDKKMFKSDITGTPALHLVWKGIAGGAIGAIIGTWIYPDLGTLVGSTLGVIGGVLFGEVIDFSEYDEKNDPELQLETSKKARAFFNSIRPKIKTGQQGQLPITEKKQQSLGAMPSEGYRLHLFDQAITSRGTGVFPHKRKPKTKPQK